MAQKNLDGRRSDPGDEVARDFQTFANEVEDDKKGLRVATLIAFVFHAGILAVHFPQIEKPAMAEPEKPMFFAIHTPPIRPPKIDLLPIVPEPRARRTPIPDPTPDLPEPIRMATEVEPELRLTDTGLLFDLPTSPPPLHPKGPIMMAPDVVPPVKIHTPAPRYTEIARLTQTEGVVIVQAIIDRHGLVTNARILRGLPMGLDEAALEAVKQWRFEAASLNGKPVSVFYTLTIHFDLQ